MREENSAVRGMFALSAAGIIAKILSVFYSPILVAVLGEEGLGIYSKTLEVFLFVYAIACTGTQPAVAKVVTELTVLGNNKGAIRALQLSRRLYMFLGGTLGAIMMLIAFPIGKLIGTPEIGYGVIALGPCVLITAVLATYRGFMQGKNNMTSIAISQILEQLFNVIISLIGAVLLVKVSLPLGSAGAQIGTSAGALIACFYLIYCYDKKRYKVDSIRFASNNKKVSDKKILRKIIRYSIPITMSAALQNLGGLVDMINVSQRLAVAGFNYEAGNALYGQYAMYKTLSGVPLVLITAIATISLPAISRSFVINDRKEVKSKISSAFRITFAIAVPAAVGLSILSSEVYTSLYNGSDGASIMTIGSFIIVLMAITQIQSIVLQSINKLYFVIKTFAIGIVFKIVLNYIFVGMPEINIYGVLIGNCFWYLVPAILNHKKICSEMKMRLSIRRLITKPLLASIVMGGVLFVLRIPTSFMFKYITPSRLTMFPVTILLVAIGGLAYVYLMIVMGGITKKDIKMISPKLMRILPRFMKKKLI